MEFENYLKLIYVIACVIHGVTPASEMLSGCTEKELYTLAKKHSLLAMTGYGLNQLNKERANDKRCSEKDTINWEEEIALAQRKILLMDTERESILNYMEQNGIWYMPLKGALLKEIYPDLGLREMSDNDILYDQRYKDTLKKYMIGRGYVLAKESADKDDAFHKPPVYNFEFHRSLFEHKHSLFLDYYKNINKRLIRDEGKQYGYHFSDEDFYIYMIAHAYKHFYYSGTGLRSLIDIYLYVTKKKLNWEYIKSELEVLKIARFERFARKMAYKLFDKVELLSLESFTQREKEFLTYITGSGTYGNETNKLVNRAQHYMHGSTKKLSLVKFCYNRLFPDKNWLKLHEPEIYNNKILRVRYYLGRITRAVSKAPHVIWEIRLASQQKGKDNKRKW